MIKVENLSFSFPQRNYIKTFPLRLKRRNSALLSEQAAMEKAH